MEFEGHTGQIDNVLSAILGEENVLICGKQGRNTLEMITAIYESAHIGKTVKLPLTEHNLFYTREGFLSHAHRFYEKKASIENFSENIIISGGN